MNHKRPLFQANVTNKPIETVAVVGQLLATHVRKKNSDVELNLMITSINFDYAIIT